MRFWAETAHGLRTFLNIETVLVSSAVANGPHNHTTSGMSAARDEAREGKPTQTECFGRAMEDVSRSTQTQTPRGDVVVGVDVGVGVGGSHNKEDRRELEATTTATRRGVEAETMTEEPASANPSQGEATVDWSDKRMIMTPPAQVMKKQKTTFSSDVQEVREQSRSVLRWRLSLPLLSSSVSLFCSCQTNLCSFFFFSVSFALSIFTPAAHGRWGV